MRIPLGNVSQVVGWRFLVVVGGLISILLQLPVALLLLGHVSPAFIDD